MPVNLLRYWVNKEKHENGTNIRHVEDEQQGRQQETPARL
jgi:hypothetical protein